jgi:hypothetical protein
MITYQSVKEESIDIKKYFWLILGIGFGLVRQL